MEPPAIQEERMPSDPRIQTRSERDPEAEEQPRPVGPDSPGGGESDPDAVDPADAAKKPDSPGGGSN